MTALRHAQRGTHCGVLVLSQTAAFAPWAGVSLLAPRQ